MKRKNLLIIYLSEFLILAVGYILLAVRGNNLFTMPAYALVDPPTLSALVTLYTAAQNEYILAPAQLFVTILPAILLYRRNAVKKHAGHIYEKMAVNGRNELIKIVDDKWEN